MGKKNERVNERTPYGTLYQNEAGGWFYFRYQANGRRHNEGLGTRDYAEAKKIVNAKYAERVQKDRLGLNAPEAIRLSLGDAWKKYSESPERATPATVSERQSYETTWGEFVEFMGNPKIKMQDVTYQDANRYANFLREKRNYAVDTHNRKIKRIRKVFKALHDYWTGTNPFDSPTLLRRSREEQDMGVRRLGFTAEQEQRIREVLENPKKKVKNKAEIRVVFYLGIYTGQRLKDCVLARWNNIDLTQRRMEVEQNKTGKFVSLPIAPQLEAVLREAQAWRQPDGYVCPLVAHRYNQTDGNGKNTGSNLVNIDVMRVIRWAGIEASVKTPGRDKSVSVYGFHSLRHSFASHCAELGIPLAVVQSILGDDLKILSKYYTHIGREAQRDAIEKLAGTVGMLSADDRIDRALEFIEGRAEKTTELLKIKEILTTRDHVVDF